MHLRIISLLDLRGADFQHCAVFRQKCDGREAWFGLSPIALLRLEAKVTAD
jgi:hypothetical protein